jgi:Spy/CpxP family protein refolding chaperone
MKKLAILAVAAIMMAAVPMCGQPADGQGFKKIMAKLNLTDEQKKSTGDIRVDMEKQEIAQKAKIETARVELQQLFKADNPDKSAIEGKMDEIAKLEVRAKMIRIDSWFAVNKILTPEQQKTWRKVLESAPKMKHHGMEKGLGHPAPKK